MEVKVVDFGERRGLGEVDKFDGCEREGGGDDHCVVGHNRIFGSDHIFVDDFCDRFDLLDRLDRQLRLGATRRTSEPSFRVAPLLPNSPSKIFQFPALALYELDAAKLAIPATACNAYASWP